MSLLPEHDLLLFVKARVGNRAAYRDGFEKSDRTCLIHPRLISAVLVSKVANLTLIMSVKCTILSDKLAIPLIRRLRREWWGAQFVMRFWEFPMMTLILQLKASLSRILQIGFPQLRILLIVRHFWLLIRIKQS
jgi:hypothetical protein